MITETLVKNLAAEVQKLRKDVIEIKHLVFAVPEDEEGEYKESYVKKLLNRAKSQGPAFFFTSKEQFLKHVRKAR